MNTLVNVARYHLVDRLTFVALPWGIMAFSFLVNIVISAAGPYGPARHLHRGAGDDLHLPARLRRG